MKLTHRILAVSLAFVMFLLNSGVAALAEAILTMPDDLQVIEEEAFYGSTSIDKVILSDNVEEIRARAFANSSLSAINLPDSLNVIADDAFDGPEKVVMTANPGTYAYDWAVNHNYIAPELMISSLIMDREEYAVGETATWTVTAQYGVAPYRYQFSLYKDTTRIKQSSMSTANTYSYTFTEAGTYHMIVRVRDSEYTVSKDYIGKDFIVTEPESSLRVTATPDQESAYLHDSISWTAAAEGGVEPYRYSFKLFVDGKQSAIQTYSLNNVFSTVANTAADYTLQVDVLDAENNGATFTTEPFTILLEELHLESFYVDLPEAQTEDTIHWYAQAAGGQDPYAYAYTLKKDSVTIDTKEASDATSYEYTVLEPGTYTLTVTATDAVGHTVTASADSVVALRPVAVTNITASSDTYMTENPVTWTVTAEGGDRNYIYAFTLYRDEEEVDFRSFAADNTFTYTPDEAGTYTVEVTVRDSAKRAATQTGGEVTISLHPLEVVSVTADSDMVRFGNAVTLTAEAVGGLTPLRYSYEVYNEGNTLVTASAYNLSATYTYTAATSGVYTFKVKVRDAQTTIVEMTSSPVTFYDALTISDITASANSVLTGEGVTWTAERIGGKGTVNYDWFIYRDNVLEYTERNALGYVKWAPLMSGTYTAKVVASDEDNESVEFTGGQVVSGSHSATSQSEFTFSVLNGTYCSLTKYIGSDESVIIPGEWTDDNNVTRIVQSIAYEAFSDNKTVTSVIIPDSVERMGSSVFRGCSNLIYVKGGAKLINVGDYAFQDCVNLRRYDFESATTSMGNYAFYGCTSISRFEGWNGLANVGEAAFSGNKTLTEITLVQGIQTIGANAFNACTNLTSVDLPDGLLRINSHAFNGCIALESIHLPDSITTLEGNIFYGCSKLTTVNYPKNWTDRGNYSTSDSPFTNCPKLVSITIPEGVTAIPYTAFKGAGSLRTVDLPSTLITINNYAFYGCAGLTGVVLPDSVTSLGEYAYASCTGLTSISVSSGITTISNNTFSGCTGLTSVDLPDGLLRINYYAFNGCTALESIHLPDSITTLGGNIFYGCSKLTTVNYPKNWTDRENYSTSDSPFTNCPKLVSITIPEGVTAIPYFAFKDAGSLRTVDLPSTLITINNRAFYGCAGLTGVVLPDSVTSLGEYAYASCTGLTSISVSSGITTISNGTFSGCTGLTSVDLPDGLLRINSYAFYGCTALESIHLPDSITTLEGDIFYGCSKLTTVNYPKNWTDRGTNSTSDSPFTNCPKLVSITIPEGVTAIPYSAFKDAGSLRTVDLPSTLIAINNRAFYGCAGLTGVVLPDSVTSLGEYAYASCTGLTSISVSSGITTISNGTFYGCTGLTSVDLPDGLLRINFYAFYGCTALESIHLPDSITTLEGDIFYGCSKLTTVNYPKNWTDRGTNSTSNSPFTNCSKLVSITIPEGVTAIPYSAFAQCSSLVKVYVPRSVKTIGNYAFYNHNANLIIYGRSGSPIETWCRENNIMFSSDLSELNMTTISAHVLQENGRALQGVAVTIYEDNQQNYQCGSVSTDETGSWSWSGALQGYTYWIHLSKEGYAFSNNDFEVFVNSDPTTTASVRARALDYTLNTPQLNITGATQNSISLAWNKVDSADSYVIYRSVAHSVAVNRALSAKLMSRSVLDENGFNAVKTINNADTLSWTDSYLSSGVEYQYVIQACVVEPGEIVSSEFSEVAYGMTENNSVDYTFAINMADSGIDLTGYTGFELENVQNARMNATVNSSDSWTATVLSGGDWFTINGSTSASGASGATNITMGALETGVANPYRSATFAFSSTDKAGYVHTYTFIAEQGVDPREKIIVGSNVVTFTGAGGTEEVSVTAPGEFTAGFGVAVYDWVTVTVDNGKIILHCLENNTSVERTRECEIQCEGCNTKYIRITQAAQQFAPTTIQTVINGKIYGPEDVYSPLYNNGESVLSMSIQTTNSKRLYVSVLNASGKDCRNEVFGTNAALYNGIVTADDMNLSFPVSADAPVGRYRITATVSPSEMENDPDAWPYKSTTEFWIEINNAPVSSGTYNPDNAVTYAKAYATSYNTAYSNYMRNDCANYVSQCMVAGGLSTDDVWKAYSGTWTDAISLHDYLAGRSDVTVYDLWDASTKTRTEALDISRLSKGDVIWCVGSTGFTGKVHGHVMFVTEVGNGYFRYCAHTNDASGVKVVQIDKTDGMYYHITAYAHIGSAGVVEPTLTAPSIYANSKKLNPSRLQNYPISNGDLTISWGNDQGGNGSYIVTIGQINEAPLFGDAEGASTQLSQNAAIMVNGDTYYRFETTTTSVTIPASMIEVGKNLKIAVASRNNSGKEKWTVTALLPQTAIATVSLDADTLAAYAVPLIVHNETGGDYGFVTTNDNGAMAIGCFQWNGNEAKALLYTIAAADAELTISILGTGLYNEICNKNISWDSRTATSEEAANIRKLLKTDVGLSAQNERGASRAMEAVSRAKNTYKFTNPEVILYYADCYQWPGYANGVASKAITAANGDASAVTLALFAATLRADPNIGDDCAWAPAKGYPRTLYVRRHDYCEKYISSLHLLENALLDPVTITSSVYTSRGIISHQKGQALTFSWPTIKNSNGVSYYRVIGLNVEIDFDNNEQSSEGVPLYDETYTDGAVPTQAFLTVSAEDTNRFEYLKVAIGAESSSGEYAWLVFGVELISNEQAVTELKILANDSFEDRMKKMQKAFPEGYHWNHRQEDTYQVMISVVGDTAGFSPFVTTVSPTGTCPSGNHHSDIHKDKDHPEIDWSKIGTCNVDPNGTKAQCLGFTRMLGWAASGKAVPDIELAGVGSNKISELDSVTKGDIIWYKTGKGHKIFVTDVNGEMITYADCNSDDHCTIGWKKQIPKDELKETFQKILHYNDYAGLTVIASPVNSTVGNSGESSFEYTIKWTGDINTLHVKIAGLSFVEAWSKKNGGIASSEPYVDDKKGIGDDALKRKSKNYIFYPAKDSAIGDYPVQIWTEDVTGKESNVWTGKLTVSNIDYKKGKSAGKDVYGIQVYSEVSDVEGYRYFPKEAEKYGIIDFSSGKSPYSLNESTLTCIQNVKEKLYGDVSTGQVYVTALWGEYYYHANRGKETWSSQGLHEGLDLQYTKGTPDIYSLTDGIVKLDGSGTSGVIAIEQGDYWVIYMHCSSCNVNVGDPVTKGEKIGAQGDKGASGVFHVHLSVWPKSWNGVGPSDYNNDVNETFNGNLKIKNSIGLGQNIYSILNSLMED